ncbi:MAG: hypothetical protein EPN21_03525 [Methylococcaceae bacterium]|nr:MAG: hypothetical protein EPN21_03525 [Methylococcaceae bacterium]
MNRFFRKITICLALMPLCYIQPAFAECETTDLLGQWTVKYGIIPTTQAGFCSLSINEHNEIGGNCHSLNLGTSYAVDNGVAELDSHCNFTATATLHNGQATIFKGKMLPDKHSISGKVIDNADNPSLTGKMVFSKEEGSSSSEITGSAPLSSDFNADAAVDTSNPKAKKPISRTITGHTRLTIYSSTISTTTQHDIKIKLYTDGTWASTDKATYVSNIPSSSTSTYTDKGSYIASTNGDGSTSYVDTRWFVNYPYDMTYTVDSYVNARFMITFPKNKYKASGYLWKTDIDTYQEYQGECHENLGSSEDLTYLNNNIAESCVFKITRPGVAGLN